MAIQLLLGPVDRGGDPVVPRVLALLGESLWADAIASKEAVPGLLHSFPPVLLHPFLVFIHHQGL